MTAANGVAEHRVATVLVALACLLGASGASARCPAYCLCQGKSGTICFKGLARNPPKDAALVSPINLFAPALEIELLSLGSKRCATPLGKAADCLRQHIAASSLFGFNPKLAARKCACPRSSAELCSMLPKLSTSAYGQWVPTDVYSMLQCTRQPALANSMPRVPASFGSDNCSVYTNGINSLLLPVIDSLWPSVQSKLPADVTLDINGHYETGVGWPVSLAYLETDVALHSLQGLNTMPEPVLNVDEIPICTNLSAIAASLILGTGLASLKVTGDASLYYYPWRLLPVPIPTTAYVTVTLKDVKLNIGASANTGLTGGLLTGYLACASIGGFQPVTMRAGSTVVDVTWTVGGIPLWGAGWLLDWLTQAIIAGMIDPLITDTIPDAISDALNKQSVLSQLAGCKIIDSPSPWNTCRGEGCLACPLDINTCADCKSGYGLLEGVCYPVTEKCQVAACKQCAGGDPYTCQTCNAGFAIVAGTTTASKAKCAPCPADCATCAYGGTGNSKVSCLSCAPDYAYYYNATQRCYSCTDHCTTCPPAPGTSNPVCNTCEDNYFLGSDRTCSKCFESTCVHCKDGNDGSCTQCHNSWALKRGKCNWHYTACKP